MPTLPHIFEILNRFLGDICCASYGWYLRKSNSQHELLDQTNKKLHEISHKINELEIEDRLNRRVEEVLSSIEQRLARVNHNDEDFGTEIQEIRNNMESVEVENVSASKSTEHRRSNERA